MVKNEEANARERRWGTRVKYGERTRKMKYLWEDEGASPLAFPMNDKVAPGALAQA